MIRKSLTVLAHGAAMGALALSSMAAAKERQPVSSTVDVPMPPAVSGSALPPVSGAPVVPAVAMPQTVQPGVALAPGWWHGFGSPALDALVDRALAANTDIKAAQARLAQAQALVGAARGGLFPQVDAGLTSERQRLSRTLSTPLSNPNPQVFSLHTAQVSVSYSPDLFGGTAARVRSAKAQAAVAAAQADGVRNMVAANVALAVIQNAALDAEIAATGQAVENNRQVLTLLQTRQRLGAVGLSDVAAQSAALAAIEGQLPPLLRQRQANLSALSVLLAEAPNAPLEGAPGQAIGPMPPLDALTLPAQVPVALPADLLAARPDVAASAAALEGAAADVKVAIAARLPQINLTANAGGIAEDFGKMFASGNPFWQLIGGIVGPIFHGGTLKKQEQAARDALEAAKAQYKGTALQAFADVSNSLTALSTDTTALDVAARGDQAASQSLTFVRRQLSLGSVGTLQVLNATATAQTARVQYVAAKAARLTDTVALYAALGGGLRAGAGAALASTDTPRN
ncbi:efflux transporter outer membrane subunit [Novosphingobium fluoreni]|uniref:efflux transporter outer membrane subunit n=1 Tax=Novosphingobium fluoreni TaxID=1391222 RepID=UPI003DA1504E